MPRVDDYREAFRIAREALSKWDPDLVASLSGAEIQREREGVTRLSLGFLNQAVEISWPDFLFTVRGLDRELPIEQQVLVLHYLQGTWSSKGPAITGEWISFQEVPDGRFYLDAFQRRAKIPLVQAYGSSPQRLVEIAKKAFGAAPLDRGDVSVVVRALPLVPVALVLWKGDEEFPPEGNLLFDRNVSKILSAEDIAWLAGMVVYPLIGMAKR